ncbi:MAG TPA: hypothetical protein VMZ11_08125 [Mycobacteriales bacterium]|nr:hypothetical protein [Mycobacteriales bacterium]
MATLTIPTRFNGPADSANGGVSCGLLAQATGLDEITLRRPPPLGVPMRLEGTSLYDGDALVATAAAGAVTVSPVAPVTLAEAAAATAGYRGTQDHPYPSCFVCGPEHPTGLHLFAGPVRDDVVAAPWTPVDDDPVMVWAALDCPSAWASDLPGRPLLLGRMSLQQHAVPVPGEEHVVMGWLVGEEGRKVLTGSALYTSAGDLVALAQHTWIAVTP